VALRNIDSFGFEHLRVGNNAARLVESSMAGISAFKDEPTSTEDLGRYLNEKDAKKLSEEANDLEKLSDILRVTITCALTLEAFKLNQAHLWALDATS